MSALQTFIRKKLNETHLSVNALERKAGLKTNAVHNILSGASKNPKIETLQAIAAAFECSVKELIEGKADASPALRMRISGARDNLEWDASLYLKIFHIFQDRVYTLDITPTAEKAHSVIWEIYLYTLSHAHKEVDPRFADWLIQKSFC